MIRYEEPHTSLITSYVTLRHFSVFSFPKLFIFFFVLFELYLSFSMYSVLGTKGEKYRNKYTLRQET